MARKTSTISQRTKMRISIVLILLLAVVAGFLDYPKIWNNSVDFINAKVPVNIPHFLNLEYHLGLDLQGGTHLVYQADVEQVPGDDQADAVEGVRDVIERRVNAFGVAEPLVQTNKVGDQYRVIVELAGIKDVKEAIQMIGETPLLEFKEQNTEQPELTNEQVVVMEEYNKNAKSTAQDILKQVLNDPGSFGQVATEKSEDLVSKTKEGDIGYIKEGLAKSEFYDELQKISQDDVFDELVENAEGYNILKRGDVQDEDKARASHILICYSDLETCDQERSKEDAEKLIQEIKDQANGDNFADLSKQYSDDTVSKGKEISGDLDFFAKGQMVKEFEDVVFNMEVGDISGIIETQFGYHLIYKTDSKPIETIKAYRILIKKQTEADIVPPEQFKYSGLSGKHLKRAQISYSPNTNEPEVSLEFNDEGKDLFAEITERNVNKVVGIFLDGEPISLPRVNQKISEGRAVITGKFTQEEAKTLVLRLNAGALPVPIELISQQTVGASLGQESLNQSLYAAMLGLLLVGLFMILFYRIPGIVSVISLCIYGLIILAIFKLIAVTLTLAGIAGFILSVGMAVDANVLIFERMKEELKKGKPLGTSIDEGFKRAWPSIRDGNMSTLITCVILFWFGTSLIQGFALTLFIGIIISMFSALFITRTILHLIINCKLINRFDWLFLYKKSIETEKENIA